MDKRRILLFAEGVTLTHVSRPLIIADELTKLGYEVHLAADPRYARFTKSSKAILHHIHSLPTELFLSRIRNGKPLFTFAELNEDLEEDLRLIDSIKPDLIIGDMRLSLTVSARLRKIPLAMLTNSYWSPYGKPKIVLPDYPSAKILGFHLTQIIFNIFYKQLMATLNRPINKLRKQRGFPPLGDDYLKSHTDADIVLYADMRELHPVHNAPDSHHYIGPISWSPDVPLPDWWANLPTDRPVVYVSMGSSGAVELLPKIFAALSELPVTVIATTASRATEIAIPDNCYIADYLPGTACANRASLVICNGGSTTSYQSLCAGVPVLGIVSLADQHLFMQGVEKSHAGILICSPHVTVKRLRNLVNEILSDESYSKSAKVIAEKAKPYDLAAILDPIVNRCLENRA